jgi:4-hydroxybenzoate polyprenyltransferase
LLKQTGKYFFWALRPKQWVKNTFIFLPLIFGRKLFILPELFWSLVAFCIFSLVSSTGYLINDLMDVQEDRLHPLKRLRPIASGKLSVKAATLAAFLLGFASVASAFMLDIRFGWIVIIYCIFNLLYTKFLKEVVIIDVFCLGLFFLLRIIAGSVISAIELSHWIIIMTVLLALFLGFNKRRQELNLLEEKAVLHRRVLIHYDAYFIDQMIAVITSSIVVVYMLYTIDIRTVREFGSTHLMYSIPFVYYGIFRYLYLIHKVKKEGDPTSILLSDAKMLLNLLLWITVCVAVIYFRF